MRMHFPLIVFFCMFISILASSHAGNSSFGWGVVNMQGAIIETACAIAVESQDQSIDMEVIPMSVILRDGEGKVKNFSIELVNCVFEHQDDTKPDWKQFQITFDGDAEGDFFSVQGEASGVALKITDKSGNLALPGQPFSREDIIQDEMKLNYQLRLVANHSSLKAGNFSSAIRFKLDYF